VSQLVISHSFWLVSHFALPKWWVAHAGQELTKERNSGNMVLAEQG
jgi:hypothetical protein